MNTACNRRSQDPWGDLAAQRAAEDELLLRAFASDNGGGERLRVARSHVDQARTMLGPEATFGELEMVTRSSGYEVTIWYHFDQVASDVPASMESVTFWTDAVA